MSKLKDFIPTAFKVQRLLPHAIGGKHQYYGTADWVNFNQGVDDFGNPVEPEAGMRQPEPPEALLFYLPPLQSPGLRYGHFFERIHERLGFAVASINLHANPKNFLWFDEKAIQANYLSFFEEVDAEYTRQLGRELPKFIIGDGVGALWAQRICLDRPDHFKGCITLNPLLEFSKPFRNEQLMRLLGSVVAVAGSSGSSAKAARRAAQDALDTAEELADGAVGELTMSQIIQIRNLQAEVRDRVRKQKVPQLWLLGEDDEVASNHAAHSLFNEMKQVRHKRILQVAEAPHNMLQDENSYPEAQREVSAFIQRLLHDMNIRK